MKPQYSFAQTYKTVFINQFVHPVGGKGMEGYFYFIREHENLVQDPSNNISIYLRSNHAAKEHAGV